MKSFIFVFFFMTNFCFANSVTIEAGSSVLVDADSPTKVICNETKDNDNQNSKGICFCRASSFGLSEAILNLRGNDILLGTFNGSAGCIDLLNKTPGCK